MSLRVLAVFVAVMACPILNGQERPLIQIPAGILPGGGGAAVSTFRIGVFEVTWAEWHPIRTWAIQHGYVFGPGHAEGPDYPVSAITWYDAVKFCNAASELAGLKPVYVDAPTGGNPYRNGEIDLPNACMRGDADGFRLPTGSEWEFAARAGSRGPYSWGAVPDPAFAWFTDHTGRGDDVSPHAVGGKKPNAFGLFDTSGNVAEWTWERFLPDRSWRVQRGGSVALDNDVTVTFRSPVPAVYRTYDAGLRIATTSLTCPTLSDLVATKRLTAPTGSEPLLEPYDGTDVTVVAARLARLLDARAPGAQSVLAAQRAGKAEEALVLFRDQFLSRLRACSEPLWPNTGKLPEPGVSGAQAWLTAEERQALHAKTEFDNGDNHLRASLNSYDVPRTWDFGMGFSSQHQRWFEVIRRILASGIKDEDVPAIIVANLAIYTATDDVSQILKDPREMASNQQMFMARTLIQLARLMPDFLDTPAWEQVGSERFEISVLRFVLADGGDVEQSFNYMGNLFGIERSVATLFAGRPQPSWVDRLHELAIYRLRMFAALRLASGEEPNVGNNAYSLGQTDKAKDGGKKKSDPPSQAPLEDDFATRMMATFQKGAAGPAPAFTSIAFPFSGYYLQRSGWGTEGSTLFLKASRPGNGHCHADSNAIELCAYGQHLLVGRESPPYGPQMIPEPQRKDYLWIDEYKNGPLTANAVLIDGCAQQVEQHANGYEDTIPRQFWHTDADFDAVQGVVDRLYGSIPALDPAKVAKQAADAGMDAAMQQRLVDGAKAASAVPSVSFSARQTRQVVYVRKANLWIVTDWAERSDGKAVTSLTQLWRLPAPFYQDTHPLYPGFSDHDVVIGDQLISTKRPSAVNLAIINAANGAWSYAVHFGEKYPYRGWANLQPSMWSGVAPAVDVDATMAGSAPAIAVLVPIPAGRAFSDRVKEVKRSGIGDQARVELVMSDGMRISYLARSATGPLQAPGGAIATDALLTVGDGRRTVGLHLERVGAGGVFTVDGDRRADGAAIAVPETFRWAGSGSDLHPIYRTGAR